MIQVDLDPSIIGANKPVDLAIQADAKTFLLQLLEKLSEKNEIFSTEERQGQIQEFLVEKTKQRKKLDRYAFF